MTSVSCQLIKSVNQVTNLRVTAALNNVYIDIKVYTHLYFIFGDKVEKILKHVLI